MHIYFTNERQLINHIRLRPVPYVLCRKTVKLNGRTKDHVIIVPFASMLLAYLIFIEDVSVTTHIIVLQSLLMASPYTTLFV